MGIAIPQVVTEDRASGALVVDGSLKFIRSDSNVFKRTPSTIGNRRAFTWSGWVKRSNPSVQMGLFSTYASAHPSTALILLADGSLRIQDYASSAYNIQLDSNARLRDPNAFFHIVVSFDTTQATTSNRVKVYINGEQLTSFSTANYGSQNLQTDWNNTTEHNIGRHDQYLDGCLSNAYCIDGQALDASHFGYTDPLTNTWRPKIFERGTFEELDKFNTYTWGEPQNQLYYQGIKFPTSAGGTVAWKATGSSNTGLNLYTSTDNATWTRRLTNQTVDSTNGLIYESTYQYVILVNGSNATWANQIQLFSDVNGATIHYSNGTYPGNGNPTMSWSGPAFSDGTIASYNSFYLPMDGNSPIGEDQSGKGNNWTPVNFGGSNSLDKATGAKPILNTDGGGNVARTGVFGSEAGAFYATTSASNSGGKYYFSHDAAAQPTFSFIRGATYTFDYSASSSHPLRFATAADAAGSTEYTDGTNISGNVIKFTVPHNAPNTLYYYCNVHNGMGNSISVTTDETKADPYAWKCVLAMPLVGRDNDVSNQINSGSTTKTITVSNNAAASSDTSNFYNGSFEFDGTDDALTTSDLGGSVSQYTMECWINTDGFSQSQRPINASSDLGGTGYLYIEILTSKNIKIRQESTGSAESSGGVLSSGKWHHLALSYDGVRLRGFVDGVFVCQTSANGSPVSLPSVMKLRLGADEANLSSGDFDGYIQDARVYFGACKYTAATIGDQAFVVPATNPDILPDTPSGVSGGSKLAKITDGAVSFPGATTDYLSTATSSDYAFGTGDFTVEGYVYQTAQSTYPSLMEIGNHINTTGILFITSMADGNAKIYSGGFLGGAPLSMHRWNHVAFVRISGVLKIYVNGLLGSSNAFTNDLTDVASIKIGGATAGSGYMFGGQISNVRVVKGTAVYTGNFTPPTEPLTNVTNTKLLCCQSTVEPGGAAVAPNVSGINNGTQWSNYLTGAGGFQGSYPATKAFNGTASASETSRSTNNGETQTFAPPAGIPYSSKVEVWTYYTGNVSLNGGSNVAVSDDQDWRTIATGSGTLNTLAFIGDSGNSIYLAGIRIDSTTILIDPVSPNGDTAATTFNPFNTDINTVRGQETGYATFNPSDSTAAAVLSDGNLNFASSSGWAETISTINIPTTGKWYVEQIYIGGSSNLSPSNWGSRFSYFGVCTNNYILGSMLGGSNCLVLSDRNQISNFGNQAAASGAVTKGPGGTVSLALNRDDNTYEFFYQGVSIDSGTIGTTDSDLFFMVGHHPGNTTSFDFNFGQKPFKFPPPDGFQSLNAANVRPETVIARPDQFVSTVLWTGNSTARSIVTNNAPDFVWTKLRNDANNHNLFDSVRGAEKKLRSSSNTGEATESGSLTAFNSDGFSLGTTGNVNGSYNYVAWCWKAGGGKSGGGGFFKDGVEYASAAAAGLTGGSITPTGASVGTRQGFSIVTFTASGSAGSDSCAHGLNDVPGMVIIKRRDATDNWFTWHSSFSNLQRNYLLLDTNAAVTLSSNDSWGAGMTSSVIGFRSQGTAAGNMIAYIWHDVPGLQKFGKYTGNGNADGPFIELGFKPSIIIIKRSDGGTENWTLWDASRNPENIVGKQLYPNLSAAESDAGTNTSYGILDFVSNGVKLRGSHTSYNSDGGTFIYCAWAEAPSFNLYGAQSNAR